MTEIRRFRPADAAATRKVFVDAVRIGAAGRYSASERQAWVPDAAMPEDWGSWLGGHITFVADEAGRIAGFMMLERDGYLNMAFVAPDRMGSGLAGSLYEAILTDARAEGLDRLFVWASRYAEGFFRRRGWRLAPEITDRRPSGMAGSQQDNPISRAMALDKVASDDRPL